MEEQASTQPESQQTYINLIAWQQSVSQELKFLSRQMRRVAKISSIHENHLNELNGSLKALQTVKEITPQLQVIAEQFNPDLVERIVRLAEDKADDEAFKRGLQKRLKWFSPVRVAMASMILAATSGAVYEITKFLISGHF